MSLTSFKAVIAKFTLALLETEEMIQAADSLLMEGIYSYSLGELATYGTPHGKGPPRLFTDAVQELGFELPSRQEAVTTLARRYIERIAEATDAPFDGILRMWSEFYQPPQYTEDVTTTCQGVELRNWYYLHSDRMDLHTEGILSREEVDKQLADEGRAIVAQARQWIRDHYQVRIDRSWLSWNEGTVMKLAESIAADGAFNLLPILADALEDAGCDNAVILAHCRSGSEHVRGCWVVDLILGKS